MNKLKLFNIFIIIAFLIFVLIFVLFFSIDEDSISKDISSRYSNAEVLIQKDIKDTKIVLFSVGDRKTGIANYIELPFVKRFFCQRTYALNNLEGQSQAIADVFKGKWAGYCITATPENIKLEDISNFYGLFWPFMYSLGLLICIEGMMYLHIKRKSRG